MYIYLQGVKVLQTIRRAN